MTHSNTSASSQAIKPEATFVNLLELVLETKDETIKKNIEKSASEAFSELRQMWEVEYAKNSFQNSVQGYAKSAEFIDSIIKAQTKQSDGKNLDAKEEDRSTDMVPALRCNPTGVKPALSFLFSKLLGCGDVKTVKYVKEEFEGMILDGLSTSHTIEEKYEYLKGAKWRLDFPFRSPDAAVREMFYTTLDKIKSETSDFDLKRCIDKVKDRENIFKSWQEANENSTVVLINKFTKDISDKIKDSVKSINEGVKEFVPADQDADNSAHDNTNDYQAIAIGEVFENALAA